MDADLRKFLRPKDIKLLGRSVSTQKYRPMSGAKAREREGEMWSPKKVEPKGYDLNARRVTLPNSSSGVHMRPVSSLQGRRIDRLTKDILEPNGPPKPMSIYKEDFKLTALRTSMPNISFKEENNKPEKFEKRPLGTEEPEVSKAKRNLTKILSGPTRKRPEFGTGILSRTATMAEGEVSMVGDERRQTLANFKSEEDLKAASPRWESRTLMGEIKTKSRSPVRVEDLPPEERPIFDKELCQFITGKCTCGKCRWPVDLSKRVFRPLMKSTYAKDFVPQDPKPSLHIPHEKYSTKFGGQALDFMSIHRTDFRAWTTTKPKIARPPEATTFGIPLAGSSSYKQDFINFGGHASQYELPKQRPTTISELPFYGQTSYGDAYQKWNSQREKPIKAAGAGSPFPLMPFSGDSAYRSAFKGPKTTVVERNRGVDLTSEKAGTWKGQFETQSMSVYRGEQIPNCPAREVLKNLAEMSPKAAEVLDSIKY
eukprot:TRINITY_DN11948_c0_g5_i2.p1 TRINITY_DN11948_c0_g5~~TRINITY_DN11948_c0_g5_i2.p1  ORF type:complete len:483 (+),score=78.37 TRINITY_DN11948_c0_g5_i2:43-1491(+)